MTSNQISSRSPRALERAGMIALSKDLNRVSTPGLSVAKRASATPPGRLSIRTLVADTQRVHSTGTPPKPFTAKRITHNPKSQLEIVFFGDVSGSMGSLSEPLAVTRWMVTEAGLAVHAKVSTILFGTRVYPVQRPGVRVNAIEAWSARDGIEKSSSAWAFWTERTQALEHHNTAKIAIWFTDFDFVESDESTAFFAVVAEAKRHNITLVGVSPYEGGEHVAAQYGIRHVLGLQSNPVQTARLIGDKIIHAVR